MNNILWKPTKKKILETHIYKLQNTINNKYNLNISSYNELHEWSVNNISDFWSTIWYDLEIINSKEYSIVVDDENKMPGANWFIDSQLNFAENLLKFRDNNVAIEFYNESSICKQITYKELYDYVAKVSFSFIKMGIKKNDRIAAVMPNIPEAIICMLAASSIGAVWSSCSPEFGLQGILDKFEQIKPKILICSNGYSFKGKQFSIRKKIHSIANSINSINEVIMIDYIKENKINTSFINWKKILLNKNNKIDFVQLPFDHPLYIVYSSGTTGKPKSIVHSCGGTLMQHLKELKYHVDLKKNDKIFYYTTCGWMMWNWLVSSLALGSTIVLYDGNPFYPNIDSLLRIMNKNDLTIFGTSAKYISYLESKNIKPKKIGKFIKLKLILSTGSPLTNDSYDYIYKHWKKNVQLSSISGGTDIISCFALGNPCLPVYQGQLQCLGLGMSVKSYNQYGEHEFNNQGELICDKAFPSMPIYFWNDDDGKKYKNAYFTDYKKVWKHGDFISINKKLGVKIFGRSDTTLNPGGVRIGTSEIYGVLNSINYIEDSLAVGQFWKGDERIILFVKLHKSIILNSKIKGQIKTIIKNNCSPRHVPSLILSTSDIPYTINGKKVEIAVKNIINGINPKNKSSLSNPKSLELFKNIKELKNDQI